MAIEMMCGAEMLWCPGAKVRIVRDYHGAEEGVRHGKKCPHHGKRPACGPEELSPECAVRPAERGDIGFDEWYDGYCSYHEPLYMLTTHEGLVLDADGEYNGYDDSDFYAVVWNPEKECVERVTFATTRGWTYPNNAKADATSEVRAAYEAYCERMRKAAAEARAEEARKAEEAERKRPARGKRVRVVRGRKVPRGTEGVVFWEGVDGWGKAKVGIATSDRKDARGRNLDVVWTAASNCEVIVAEGAAA